jgi:peptidyl-prolyl cis-trans isomerase C
MQVVIDHRRSAPKPVAAKPVVSVNGVVIQPAEIAREAQHHPSAEAAAAWQSAAHALVVRELLLQEARRVAIEARPQTDAAGRRETEEEALIRGLIDREVRAPEPDITACRRYYDQNKARFRSAAINEAAHILFAARQDDAAAFARAHDAAEALLAELRVHPERFAALACAHSACPSAAQGGNLGQITAGQATPEFKRMLFALTPGSLCDQPVATRYGVHIVRLDRRIDGRELPFDLVARRIADYLRDSVRRRATAQYLARLAATARIEGVDLATPEAMRVN